ncbi:hypothetical protein V8D89_009373 [Ganoderma adspersum]
MGEDETASHKSVASNIVKKVSESSDEDGDRPMEQRYRMRLTARQIMSEELYTLGKFPTSPGALINNLFANHARQHSDVDDKARTPARVQNALKPGELPPCRQARLPSSAVSPNPLCL